MSSTGSLLRDTTIKTRCLRIRVSWRSVALVYCISNCRAQSSLVVLSSESSDVAESQWMSCGFGRCFAFLLDYSGVGALHGGMLTAGVPLFLEAGLTRSMVLSIVASVASRCRDYSDTMRMLKESPVVSSGQSMFLLICTLPQMLSFLVTDTGSRWLKQEMRIKRIGILGHCINTIGASETGLPLSPGTTTTLPLPYLAKVLVSVVEIPGVYAPMHLRYSLRLQDQIRPSRPPTIHQEATALYKQP